jgi:hypothetical protein
MILKCKPRSFCSSPLASPLPTDADTGALMEGPESNPAQAAVLLLQGPLPLVRSLSPGPQVEVSFSLTARPGGNRLFHAANNIVPR